MCSLKRWIQTVFFQERGCGDRCCLVALGLVGHRPQVWIPWQPFREAGTSSLFPWGGGSSFARRCRLCLQVAGFALSTLGSEVRPPPPRCLHHVGREGVEMGGRDLLCRLSVANDRDLPAGLRETSVPTSSPPRVRALQTVALFENRF